MYLTCITLNRAHPSTQQALADCCDMHRNIMKLFPPAPHMRADGRILYRVLEEHGEARLYITSTGNPDLSQAAWLHCGWDLRQRELDPLLESFAEGATLRFDLLTHPSKKTDVGRSNSARVFLRTPEERRAWFARQGDKCGFEVIACREEEPYDIRGRRSTGTIQLRVVRFYGILRITNAAAFRRAYEEGIGPEKAYGLGMLLLRRG